MHSLLCSLAVPVCESIDSTQNEYSALFLNLGGKDGEQNNQNSCILLVQLDCSSHTE